jgi:hypothetical protein
VEDQGKRGKTGVGVAKGVVMGRRGSIKNQEFHFEELRKIVLGVGEGPSRLKDAVPRYTMGGENSRFY